VIFFLSPSRPFCVKKEKNTVPIVRGRDYLVCARGKGGRRDLFTRVYRIYLFISTYNVYKTRLWTIIYIFYTRIRRASKRIHVRTYIYVARPFTRVFAHAVPMTVIMIIKRAVSVVVVIIHVYTPKYYRRPPENAQYPPHIIDRVVRLCDFIAD